MSDAIDPKLYDKRVSARYIKKGLLDAKDHERFLKSLPDLADQAMPIEATMESTELDDDEVDEDESDEVDEGESDSE